MAGADHGQPSSRFEATADIEDRRWQLQLSELDRIRRIELGHDPSADVLAFLELLFGNLLSPLNTRLSPSSVSSVPKAGQEIVNRIARPEPFGNLADAVPRNLEV